VPLGAALLVAVAVGPVAVGGQGEAGEGHVLLGGADLRVLAQPADELNLVHHDEISFPRGMDARPPDWSELEKGPGLRRERDGPAEGGGVDLVSGQDQMVVELDVQRPQRLAEAPGQGQVLGRGAALTARMVMEEDHGRCGGQQRRLGHLAGIDRRLVHRADAQDPDVRHPVGRVQAKDPDALPARIAASHYGQGHELGRLLRVGHRLAGELALPDQVGDAALRHFRVIGLLVHVVPPWEPAKQIFPPGPFTPS